MRPHVTQIWPAPVRGWMTSGSMSSGPIDGAERLDNFFVTAQGAEMRRGYTKHATLDAAAVRFLSHLEGNDQSAFFVATANDIYEIAEPADADTTPVATWSGMTSGNWSTVQFGTASGDSYTLGVNGADPGLWYNGTDMEPLTNEEVFELGYDALTADFTAGQTITGGTSGATAKCLAMAPTSATAGTLKLGAITGTFQDNEALTDPFGGSADADGTSAAGSTIKITGVDPADLNQCWIFKERVFFVEKESLSAWYLPVESIGGAASELNFSSVFRRGGNLLFGANWSLDTGSGLDDKCVFVTDQGEVAVYAGTDPDNAATWALEGVYQVGPPVDKFGAFTIGGDLMIVTDDGIFPLSQAIVRDYSAVIAGAFSAPIEDAWQRDISRRSVSDPVTVTHWQSRGMLLVSTPVTFEAKPVSFVANSRLGAWSRYVGWDVVASAVFEDSLYFADSDGLVHQANVGGTDNGTAYTSVWVPKFTDWGDPRLKHCNHACITGRATVDMKYNVKIFTDYEKGSITAPDPINEPPDPAVWGAGTWGASQWGGNNAFAGQQKWKSVTGHGFAIAPGIAITTNNTTSPEVEISNVLVRYETGSVV